MKKIVLFAFVIMLTFSATAQETQSSGSKMWLGGNAGFTSGDNNDENNSSWVFGPTFGYMLNDKMAVGINLSFDGSTNKKNNNDNDINKMSGWNVEPFFRYYYAGIGDFKFYGDATLAFGGGTTKFESNDATKVSEHQYSTLGFGVHPGFQYWFTDNWSIASTIGYLGYTSQTNNKGEKNAKGESIEWEKSEFGLNADFSTIRFSFFYHF